MSECGHDGVFADGLCRVCHAERRAEKAEAEYEKLWKLYETRDNERRKAEAALAEQAKLTAKQAARAQDLEFVIREKDMRYETLATIYTSLAGTRPDEHHIDRALATAEARGRAAGLREAADTWYESEDGEPTLSDGEVALLMRFQAQLRAAAERAAGGGA